MLQDQETTQEPASQPVFHKVAENLYRLESSGGYYALVKKGGKQFRRSLKTKDRKLAERRLKELKDQIGNLSASEDAKSPFEAVAIKWLETVKHTLAPGTIAQRDIRIRNIAPSFAGKSVRNISAHDCEQWAVRRAAQIAPQTFIHELETMRAVFDYAQRHGLILVNPALGIKRPKITFAKIQVPTREQFKKLVEGMRSSDGRLDSQKKSKAGADLVEFLAYSGARVGETEDILWSDVNFDSNLIQIRGTKSSESNRLIPMTGALRDFLGRLKSETNPKPSDHIFSVSSAKKLLATTCKRLGFPHFTHHDFRHFFATTCIESGADIPTISRWLGHSDGGALAMRTYGHLRQEHSLAMIRRVNFDVAPAENIVPLISGNESVTMDSKA